MGQARLLLGPRQPLTNAATFDSGMKIPSQRGARILRSFREKSAAPGGALFTAGRFGRLGRSPTVRNVAAFSRLLRVAMTAGAGFGLCIGSAESALFLTKRRDRCLVSSEPFRPEALHGELRPSGPI